MRPPILVLVLAGSGACGHPATSPTPPSNQSPQKPATTTPQSGDAVLAWPVARFTKVQIAEVKDCGIEQLAKQRYPASVALDALPGAFAAKGACDHAVLAAACGTRLGDAEPPIACLDAYRTAVKSNPAFVFANELLGPYFGKAALVAAPPASQHPLTSVRLVYAWDGLGTAVKWTLVASDLTTKPTIDATGPDAKPITWSSDVGALVGALGTSLASFLPVPKPLQAIDCTDNYPSWTATMTFDGGGTLELSTQGSNLLGLGGPWQMTVDGVDYLQLSPDLVRAIAALVEKIGLPIGEPMGSTCRGYDLQNEVLTGP